MAGVLALSTILALSPSGSPADAAFADQCSSPDRTLTATTSTISVAPGETVLLTGGAFTGGIDALPAGGTLCVAAGATLAPPYMNNAAGAIAVAAGATMTMPFISVGTGFSLSLEGTATFAGLNINGSSSIDVASSGDLTISNSFSPATGSITNAGTMHVASSMNLNSSVSLTNSGTLTVDQSSTVDGSFVNTGVAQIAGTLTVNGSGLVQNECAISMTGDFNNNGPSSSNQGLVLVSGRFNNNGTWRQSAVGTLGSATLTDDGHVTGFGQYRFTGSTSVQGSFVGDSASAPIVVDSTAPPGQIFDVQTGTVVNVVRGPVGQFTLRAYPAPDCATPRPAADVVVGKTGPATVTQNSTLTYSISVANAGPGPADDVVVTDALPAGLVGVTASAGGVVGATTVTWNLGTLAAGAPVILTVTGTVTAAPGTILTDVASSTSTTPDPDPGNNNGTSESSRAETFVVPVVPPNSKPVADDITVQGVTGAVIVGAVTATDPDADQTLTFSVVSGPSNGTLRLLPGGAFDYRSDPAFTGVDTATFKACDNGTLPECAQATMTFNIFPIAFDDVAQVFENESVVIPLVPDNSSPGAKLATPLLTPPTNGAVVLNTAAGTATYTPKTGYTGPDSFVFQVCSPTAPTFCDSGTVTITVLRLNRPPVIDDLTMRTTVRVPIQGQLVITDPDGDPFVALRGIPPRSGTATVGPTGLTSYVPTGDFAGRDHYTAFACDTATPVLCSTGAVTVEVLPVANPDSATTPAGVAVTVPVTANDIGSVTTPTIVTGPGNGAVTASGGAFVYTPDSGFVGTDTFSYTICGANAADLCAVATVTVTVTPPVPPTPTPTPTPPPVNPAGSTPGGGLADTGSDLGGWGWLGILTVAAGAALLFWRRFTSPRS